MLFFLLLLAPSVRFIFHIFHLYIDVSLQHVHYTEKRFVDTRHRFTVIYMTETFTMIDLLKCNSVPR